MNTRRPSTVALRRYVGRVFEDIPETDTKIPFFDHDADASVRVLPAYMLAVCDDPDAGESIADEIALRVSDMGPATSLELLADRQLVAIHELIDLSLDLYPSKISIEVYRDAIVSIASKLNGRVPVYEPVLETIQEAFCDTPRPEFTREALYFGDDDGTFDLLSGLARDGNAPGAVRQLSSTTFYFSQPAFRYWSPAYMIAELENPNEADVVAGSFAQQFQRGIQRMLLFSRDELEAVIVWCEWCARRYERPDRTGRICGDKFSVAATNIRRFIKDDWKFY